MSRKGERYCVNGHDVTKAGRREDNGGCLECIRIRQRLYARAVRAGLPWNSQSRLLSKEPLVDAIRQAASRYQANVAHDRGYRGLARLYARRFPDTTQESAERIIHRLMSTKSKRVYEETADRWCVVLGMHPVELWPSEWPLEMAPE